MLTHVIGRWRSNNFVEDYSCAMCQEAYPKIVEDKLERAWEKPKRLFRDALAMMEDGYARFVEPLVNRLETFPDHASRARFLRKQMHRQLNAPRPPSANAQCN